MTKGRKGLFSPSGKRNEGKSGKGEVEPASGYLAVLGPKGERAGLARR